MDPSSYESLRNQTLLFFIEKLLEKSPRSLHDLSCQFGSKNFTKEMRQIAGGSQSGLRKFLLTYPSLFTVEGDSVSYTTEVRQKLTRDYNKEAVEYFRSRLLQYGFNVRVPIKSLLGHRSQANSEIRHVSGQHVSEFREFLEKNPEFVLLDEVVWLKEFEHEKMTEFIEVNVNYDKESVFKLCRFIVNSIVDKGPMLVEQLFYEVGAQFEAGEFESIFKNPTDLTLFLKIQPQCFQVHSNLVTLSETYPMGLDFLQRQVDKDFIPSYVRSPSFSIQKTGPREKTNSFSGPIQQNQSPTSLPNVPFNNNNNSIKNSSTSCSSSKNGTENNSGTNGNNTGSRSLKQRVNSILLQTLSQNNEKDYSRTTHLPPSSCSGDDERSRTSAILSKITIISNRRKSKSIVDQLLKMSFLGVDCEGVNLGSDGRVTMVQVAVPHGLVFIFDLISEGLSEDIRTIMESDVVKVMHDCRNDSVNLMNQFGIKINNIFDTQSAHIALMTENGEKVKNISLNSLCELHNVEINPMKDKVKSVYRYDQRYWLRRPLTTQMQYYAAADVITLTKLYPILQPRISNTEFFEKLCYEQIYAHITPEEIKSKRRLRKNEGDSRELRLKLESCTDLTQYVLSNREARLIKHMNLPQSILDQLSNSLKMARKLNRAPLSDSSSESNLTSLECNANDSGIGGCSSLNEPSCTTTSSTNDKILSIERLIDKIFIEGGGGGGGGGKIDAVTQTLSTGDIVLSQIWDEN